MKSILTKAIFSILFPLLIAGCDWFNWNPPQDQSDATLAIHVTTNIGGPMIGPLEGAPIHILRADGSLVDRGASDKNGDVTFKLDAGTYIVDPQEVPGREDFYEPPEQQTVTLKSGEKQELRLHYDNPIL